MPARYPRSVPRNNYARRFAERSLTGIDDAGSEEHIVFWIDYQPDAQWAVVRMVNPELRADAEPREEDFVFRGFELNDALNEANEALRDDLQVSSEEGVEQNVAPFERDEILERLEHWFFHRDDDRNG
jgi:hypothetical protein